MTTESLTVEELLTRADDQLGATLCWWPLGIPEPPADELYRRALERMGENPSAQLEWRARQGLGRFYATLGNTVMGERVYWEKALPECRRAYQLRPGDESSQFCYAQTFCANCASQ